MPEQDRKQFLVPIHLTISRRVVQAPLPVSVTFEELARAVDRHLSEDVTMETALLEIFADQQEQAQEKAPQARQPEPDAFSEEELTEWRGKEQPAWKGARKPRPVRLWAVANDQRAVMNG